MKFLLTAIEGVYIIEPTVFADQRGYFVETYRHDLFIANVCNTQFIQDNESRSSYGVLRGLHYQLPPFAQSKLVRVVEGSILDVAVDIRKNSNTFGKYVSVELSGQNKRQMFIPRGFAHGFIVLSDYAVVQYKVDAPYAPEYDRGINALDESLMIDWKIDKSTILRSVKDENLPMLQMAEIE
ncbi:MAG: dTDP-4-dehydrorhamnose 3,5-epimerase [Spirochaetota bacterium]